MSSYSTDTYSITSTGEETDKIAKHTGSGKQKYIKWILTYSSDGEIQNKAMYTGTEGDEWRHSQSAQKAAGALVITGLGSTVNEAGCRNGARADRCDGTRRSRIRRSR